MGSKSNKNKKAKAQTVNSPVSTTKKRLFFAAMLVLPLLLMTGLEAGLWLLDYGDESRLFVPIPDERSSHFGMNPDIGKRYFSKIGFKPTPRKDLFLRQKPSNTYRIFVMGGSTTAGFPYGNNLMFSRILHHRLQDTFPDRHIEVVNTAMSAISSYTLLDFTAEIIAQQPDAVLIYAGHNEFYGALGVGSLESMGSHPWLIRSFLKLQQYRSVQLLRNILAYALGWTDDSLPADPTATTMARIVREQSIPLESSLYRHGKSQFQDNLTRIVQAFGDEGIPVMLSELVSNLRDQKPFISVEAEGGLAADRLFQKARALESAGDLTGARQAYYAAKDHDALRFRAPEEFNTIVHEIGEKHRLPVVPMRSYFEAASPNGITGNSLMTEHLHPNISGYFLMAEAFYDCLKGNNFLGLGGGRPEPDKPTDYRQNWGYTKLDSLYGALSVLQLKGGWPFRQTPGRNTALDSYRPSSKIDSIALEIVKSGSLTLEQGHIELAEYYKSRGATSLAFKEYKALSYIVPYWDLFIPKATELLIATGDYRQALQFLNWAARYERTPFVLKWLGQIHLALQQVDRAISLMEEARALLPEDTQLTFNLGSAYFRTSQRQKGEAVLADLERLAPKSEELKKLRAESHAHVETSGDWTYHLNLAQSHLRSRELDDALQALHASLRLRESAIANELIGEVMLFRKNFDAAIVYLEKARNLQKKAQPKLLFNLSSVYYIKKEYDKAWQIFRILKANYPNEKAAGRLEEKLLQALQEHDKS